MDSGIRIKNSCIRILSNTIIENGRDGIYIDTCNIYNEKCKLESTQSNYIHVIVNDNMIC